MISARNVTKKFGDIVALDDITFTIAPGEFVFLTGPSGSGKTTLLKLLLRELKPDSGVLEIDAVDTSKIKRSKLPFYRRQIGIVFQDFRLFPDRSVRENVSIPLQINKTKSATIPALVDSALATVDLTGRADQFPSQLSGGELQRVSLARAIVATPKLLLMDEPTGNLDPKTAKNIMTLIKKIQDELKTTILMATHNADIVNEHKYRVISLDHGKLTKDVSEGKYV